MSLVALLVCSAAPEAIERLQGAGIEVAGPFSDAEVRALASGLDALPERLRRLPGGKRARVFLDERRSPTPSGMAEPEWVTPTTFVLTPQAGFVSFRDAALGEDERRSLWRARAVVHLVLSRWDEQEQWSLAPAWRRANGWLLPFERPLTWGERALNHAPTAFSRPRGLQSARLDLLTFAEAALVPVTKLPVDDQVRCQDFTRTRALREVLGVPLASGACPAFDAWVREAELEHLEVLLVQSSGRAPESLFGHLLVRPVWKTSLGPSFDTAIQFAAITPPRPDLLYVGRGLFGGYSIGVFTISMTDLEREKLSGEQRSMTRWKLALSKAEARRFLERAWEFERRGKFSYAFFSDNCATILLWMLESSLEARDATLAKWPGFITSPGGVLDDLFRARRATGERLLSALYPPLDATGVVAQRAEAKRRELERDELSGFDFAGAHSTDVAARAAAYAELARLTRIARADQHAALFKWWALSVRVERAPADVALFEKRKLEDGLVEGAPLDLDVLWSDRLAKLERESVLQKQLMMLDRETFLDDLRRRANRRAMTPSEAEQTAEHDAQLALFTQVATAQGALSEVLEGVDDATAGAFLDEQTNAAVATEVVATTRSLPVSGHWRTGVGAGVMMTASGGFTPVVRVDEAGLLEALGEQRLRGLGAPVGVRMLDGSLTLAPALVPFRVTQSHFTLVAFDSLAAPLPPAGALKEHLGFGFELVTDFRDARSQKTLGGAQGWVMLHARDAHARNLLALGVGPAAWVADDGLSVMPMGGGSARLIGRLALDATWPSALRLEAKYQSVFGPGRALHELRADASLEWVVAWGGRPRVLLRPTVSLTAEPALGRYTTLGLVMVEPVESLTEVLSRRRD